MNDSAIAVGFAIFIWWFSTGIVILLNRMSRSAITRSLALSSLLCVAALVGLSHTAQQTSVAGALAAQGPASAIGCTQSLHTKTNS